MKNVFFTLVFLLISTFTFANNTASSNAYKDEVTVVELNEKATESNAIENLNEQTKFAMQEKQEVASAACQLTAYAEFKDGTVIEIVIGVIEGMTCAQFLFFTYRYSNCFVKQIL